MHVMRQRSPEDWGIDSGTSGGFAHRIDRVGGTYYQQTVMFTVPRLRSSNVVDPALSRI